MPLKNASLRGGVRLSERYALGGAVAEFLTTVIEDLITAERTRTPARSRDTIQDAYRAAQQALEAQIGMCVRRHSMDMLPGESHRAECEFGFDP